MTNDDYFSYILGYAKGAESGGGTVTIDTLAKLNTACTNAFDSFIKCIDDTKDSYEAYTSEAVTLYTPNSTCTNYMIHKKSDGTYRIIWSTLPYVGVRTSTSLCFCSPFINHPDYSLSIARTLGFIKGTIFDISMIPTGTGNNYYSNGFDTIDELITEIQKADGNITYTNYATNSSFSGVLDDPYLIPYTNTTAFDLRDGCVPIQSKKISANETIQQIS